MTSEHVCRLLLNLDYAEVSPTLPGNRLFSRPGWPSITVPKEDWAARTMPMAVHSRLVGVATEEQWAFAQALAVLGLT